MQIGTVASQLIVRAETQTFLQLIWRQYFVSSPEAAQFGLTDKLVGLSWHGMGWFAPHPDSAAIIQRTFFHQDWLLPILLLVIGIIVSRVTWFTSGYVLFRLVSDREKLPFPTAPQAALGAMALAEESGSEDQSWKWPAFTVGGAIGLVDDGLQQLLEILARDEFHYNVVHIPRCARVQPTNDVLVVDLCNDLRLAVKALNHVLVHCH